MTSWHGNVFRIITWLSQGYLCIVGDCQLDGHQRLSLVTTGAIAAAAPNHAPLIFRRIDYLGAVVVRNGLVFSNNRQASWWSITPIASGWICTAFSCYMTNKHSLAWCFSACDIQIATWTLFKTRELSSQRSCGHWRRWVSKLDHDCLTVSKGVDSCIFYSYKWPLLLTWFNFYPSMDK